MADVVATTSSSPALDFSAVAMVIGSCNAKCEIQNANFDGNPFAFCILPVHYLADHHRTTHFSQKRIYFLRYDDIAVHGEEVAVADRGMAVSYTHLRAH